MIKLFESNEKDFSSNGLGVINPLKCKETKKKSLNGWFLDIELSSNYASVIRKDMIVFAETKEKGGQPFRVGDISKKNNRLYFQANHIIFDSEHYFLNDVRPTSLSPERYLNWINERTDNKSPFSVYSRLEGIATSYFIRKSLLYAFEKAEELFGGTYDIDCFNLSLIDHVGNDNGFTVAYGKNLQGISIIENWSSVVTKLYPVGPNGITLPEEFIESDIHYDIPYTRTVDFDFNTSYEDDKGNTIDYTVEKQIEMLRDLAKVHIDVHKYPLVSYTVISDINQNLNIGDTIYIKHPYVSIKAEVQEYIYNILTKKVEKTTYGNYERDVKKIFEEFKDKVNQNKQNISDTKRLIEEQTGIINSLYKKGFVYIDDNEILILDKYPKEDAKQVMRINLGGIGFSSTGWEGPFYTAWTLDGKFNAKYIATDILKDKLGYNFWDLDTGELFTKYMKAVNADITGKITSTEGRIGGFDITDEGFTKTSVVTLKKTYTNDDVTRIRKIIDGTVTPTATDYSNYDVNMDGEIDSRDYIIVKDLYVPCGGNRLYTDVVINSFPYSIYDINQPLVTVRYRGAKGTIAETFLSARTLSTSYVKTEGVTADYVNAKTFSTESGNSLNSLGNILDILCINDSGWTAGQIFGQYYDGTPNLYILAENGGYLTLGNSVNRIYFQVIDDDANWHSAFYSRDGGCALGKTAKPWYRLYASNSTTVTSDERLKKNIRSYDQRFIDMYPDLDPVLYELKNFSNGSHCGLIAQRVKEAMDKHGITDEEFGVFEYDEKTDSYSIAYEELTSYNMFMIQHYASELKNQKKDIDDLKERMDKLINMLGV